MGKTKIGEELINAIIKKHICLIHLHRIMFLSSRVFLVASLVLSPFVKASEKEDVACMDAEVDYDITVKKYESFTLESGATVSLGKTECIDGMAGDFPCKNTDLLSMLSPKNLNCGKDAELER